MWIRSLWTAKNSGDIYTMELNKCVMDDAQACFDKCLRVILFMHTGVKIKYVSKLTDVRRASREDGSSTLDCRGRKDICRSCQFRYAL